LTKVDDRGKNRTGISFQLLVSTLNREGNVIDLTGLTAGATGGCPAILLLLLLLLLLEDEEAVAVVSSLY
jgi:hypothetical protein